MDSRNVVLVTVDSVRADYCGFLSEQLDTTPTLERFADDSIIFENAIAPGPQTLSSVPAIHTGVPFSITEHNLTDYQERISRIENHINSHEKIAEQFKKLGYTTACLEANPWTSSSSGFDRGYDIFHDVGGEQRKHVSKRFEGTKLGPFIRIANQWFHNDGWFSQWPDFYDKITSTVKELPEPYFLWVFLLDTHNPYIVGEQDRFESSSLGMYYSAFRANRELGGGKTTSYSNNLPDHVVKGVKKAYRDSIRSVDRFVKTLMADLSDDDPILALYSDHGEGFGEHGTFGHQHVLFEENIHVPFLIYNAGLSGRVSEPISLLKMPNILEECTRPESLSPSDWTTEYAFSRTEDSSSVAVRGERWKYITTDQSEKLFDLTKDPNEHHDMSSNFKSKLNELRSIADSHLNSLNKKQIITTSEEENNIHQRLDDLGYLG